MQNYLAVVKAKGAATAAKASFSADGAAAAIIKMCSILQIPNSEIEEYDLMEFIDETRYRMVSSRVAKIETGKTLTLALPAPTDFKEVPYHTYKVEKV